MPAPTSRLAGKVVVITGASSGLGRAAAFELARRGAWLVLGARRRDALVETAEVCVRAGSPKVIAVETDVTHEEDVTQLAERALELTGLLDVWVNNAGVTSFGTLAQTPIEHHRRVLETNLWGAVHGARAAIPAFRRQGHGVLINVGSILSKVGQPFVPGYVISKFALRGLSEALRAELADTPAIHVCTLLPYAIDTQHFEAGANFIGRMPHAMPPTQTPEHVARELVSLIERPRRELHVPRSAALGLALHQLFPRTVERAIHDALGRWHFGGAQPLDAAGNLWHPSSEAAAVHGQRGPRLRLPALLAWLFGFYTGRGLRALVR